MTADDPNRVPRSNSTTTSASTGQASFPDLKPFADQLMLIAQQLREGEFPEAPTIVDASQSQPRLNAAPPSRQDYANMARHVYATRRKRTAIFGDPDLFGEPAWDILLDLYIALADETPVSVSSACIGSAAPPTTGLRWLGILAEHGLVVREQDPEDQRRVLVRLTDHGAEAMDSYFAKVSGL